MVEKKRIVKNNDEFKILFVTIDLIIQNFQIKIFYLSLEINNKYKIRCQVCNIILL